MNALKTFALTFSKLVNCYNRLDLLLTLPLTLTQKPHPYLWLHCKDLSVYTTVSSALVWESISPLISRSSLSSHHTLHSLASAMIDHLIFDEICSYNEHNHCLDSFYTGRLDQIVVLSVPYGNQRLQISMWHVWQLGISTLDQKIGKSYKNRQNCTESGTAQL